MKSIANSETTSSYMVNAQKLMTDLLTGYDRRVVPIAGEPVRLYADLNVVAFELDEFEMKFKVHGFLMKQWYDSRLIWNYTKYNITDIRLPSKAIWSPDITLYNYLEHSTFTDTDEQLIIFHTGAVLEFSRMLNIAFCEIDMKKFPFDTQTCKLVYGSWMFDGDDVNLTSQHDEPYIYEEQRHYNKWRVESMKSQIFLRGIHHLVCLGSNTYYAVDEEETLSMRGFDRPNERDAKTGVQGSQAVPKSERDMDEIKKCVQYLAQRATITGARQEITAEWQQVALVIDRILFIFFVLTFFISTLSVFA
ncbi:neuronal acetylcholine receptor subunit alpha-10 [Octopus bimaculoides]|nr:neuronal acetylcholine receptor subunit alpha-10 [Octopus bimaculoides]|eukprot:XP_014769464.1 PREDICTED: neuronal acetylcholine receptor subunit alpha-10-like [Octopus bimaculoides]